jgi:hypothetical protein
MLNCFQQTVKLAANAGTTFFGALAAPTNPPPSARSPLRQVVDCGSPLPLCPGASAGPNHPHSSIANRKSKIKNDPRLPNHVRHQLNGRLEDGEPGKQLVEWLNGLPEVQEVLKLRFGGRPISWNRRAERLDEQAHEREMNELKQRANAPLWAALQAEPFAKIFGDGDKGRQLASMLNGFNLDLAPGTRPNRNQSPPQSIAPIQPNQTQSKPIKANQTESNPAARPGSFAATSTRRSRPQAGLGTGHEAQPEPVTPAIRRSRLNESD